MASTRRMQLLGVYSTNTRRSFNAVLTTSRNREISSEYNHRTVSPCAMTPFMPSTYSIIWPRAGIKKYIFFASMYPANVVPYSFFKDVKLIRHLHILVVRLVRVEQEQNFQILKYP